MRSQSIRAGGKRETVLFGVVFVAKAGSGMELEATVEVRRGYLEFVRTKISLSIFFAGGGIAFAGWFGGKPAIAGIVVEKRL